MSILRRSSTKRWLTPCSTGGEVQLEMVCIQNHENRKADARKKKGFLILGSLNARSLVFSFIITSL